MSKSIPKIFRKPILLKKWNKKYLAKIPLAADRDFLENQFTEEEGSMVLNRKDFDEQELKRLKSLSKAIKPAARILLYAFGIFLAVLAAGALSWQLFLKNTILTNILESRLEQVFQAQVDVEGLNLSLLRGELLIADLVIADKDKPMSNLVEFQNLAASLDTEQLLQGNLHINDLGLENLRRGGPRTSPGTLPEMEDLEPVPVVESSHEEGPSEIDKIQATVGQIDVEEILEQEMENLQSPRLIESSADTLEGYVNYWDDQTREWNGKVDRWQEEVRYVQSLNADSFSNIAQAQSTLDRLGSIYNQAQGDIEAIELATAQAQQQWVESQQIYSDLEAAIQEDYQYLLDFVSMPAGERVQWAAQILDQQMEEPVLKYLNYIYKAQSLMERLATIEHSNSESRTAADIESSADSNASPEERALPRFVLVHGYFSVEEQGIQYSVDISNLSSNPNKWIEEPTLELLWDSTVTGPAALSASLSQIQVSFEELHFDLDNSFKDLGMDELKGDFTLSSQLSYGDNIIAGDLEMNITAFQIVESSQQNMLSRTLVSILNDASDIRCYGGLSWSSQEGMDLTLQSQLDTLLDRAMGQLLEEASREGAAQLEAYWSQHSNISLAGIEDLSGELSQSLGDLQDTGNLLESYQRMAEDKKNELITDIQNRAVQQIEDQVTEQVGGLLDSLF